MNDIKALILILIIPVSAFLFFNKKKQPTPPASQLIVQATPVGPSGPSVVITTPKIVDCPAEAQDFQIALKWAKDSQKNVFVLFTSKTCSWCEVFKKRTLTNLEVQTKLKKGYVIVKVDVDVEKHKALAEKYGVHGIPHLFVMDHTGKVLKDNVGNLKPDEFLRWLP